MRRGQTLLVSVFVSGLAAQLLIIGSCRLDGSLRAEGFYALLLTLLSVYSMPFAVILASVFGDRGARSNRYSNFSFRIAMTVTVLWNVLFCSISMIYRLDGHSGWRGLNRHLQEVSTSASFLIAGALTFFFSQRASEPNPIHHVSSSQ